MTWYYYSGKVVRPVKIDKVRSISVRPNTKVEIIDESTIEFKALRRKNLLRRTSRPKNIVVEKKEVSDIKVEDVIESGIAKVIAEKGITIAKDIPPESKFYVEFTEGEQQVDIKKDESDEILDVDHADNDKALSDTGNNKLEGKRKKRR